jgi:hypothetical protein
MIVRRDGPTVRLYSRNANDWTTRLSAIATAAQRIKARSFTIDGEAVVLGPDGLSRFEELSRREASDTAILYAFDLIEHDGQDIRSLPFLDRKAAWHGCCATPSLAFCSMYTRGRSCRIRPRVPAWRRRYRREVENGPKETKTIVPAAAGWYLAFWVEPRGQRPARFKYEPIIAWELAGDEVGGKWMTPIGLEAWDLYMPEIREWAIRSPDGKIHGCW